MKKYDNIDRAKFQVVAREPFFASLLMSMKLEYTETAGGKGLWLAATDGSTLYMNPTNVNELPVDQIVGLIIHELYHVAFMHPFRRNGRDPEDWNVANDYIINENVVSSGYAIPEGGLHDPSMNATQYSSEELYNLIHTQKPSSSGGGSGDGEGSGDSMAGDILDPQGTPGEVHQKEQEATEKVVQAAQMGKAMGNVPAAVAAALDHVLNPKKDWREELAQFCSETAVNDYSFARPNRRLIASDMYLPGPHSDDSMDNLCVVVDTSGSVSGNEIVRFCSELLSAVEAVDPKQINVVYCDSAVAHVVELPEPTAESVRGNLGRYGGGGTDMTVGLDYIDDHYPDTSAAVVFTDGGTPFGNPRRFPVLWAMTCTDAVAPHGQTIHVEV